jgi:hypothetical protein
VLDVLHDVAGGAEARADAAGQNRGDHLMMQHNQIDSVND